MRKTTYIICICLLSILVFYEVRHNQTSSEEYIPTARFASMVKQENQNMNESQDSESGGDEEEKKIAYLTFDDGPSDNTVKILKTLEEKKAVATFFLIGNSITPEYEEIVRQTVKQGNAVGVHTYCHQKNVLYCNAECFWEDFNKASSIVEQVTGERPTLHRFPWGSNNSYVSAYVDELHEKLQEMGVRSYDWNVSGEDSIGGTVAKSTIFNNVKKDVTRYDEPIILLHDSASTDNTAAVLGEMIDYIRSQGYEFDTLEHREEYMFPASWR